MKTTPHPTDPAYVLAPFNLAAAQAGVPICTKVGSGRHFVGASKNGNIVCNENAIGCVYSNIHDELGLLLPAPPEGYELLDAGEKATGPVKANTGGEWFDLPFPEFAQFEGRNIYARKLPAVAQEVTDSSGASVFVYSQTDAETMRCLHDFDAVQGKEGRSWHEFKRGFDSGARWARENADTLVAKPEDSEGWIPWHGGEWQENGQLVVRVKFRNGSKSAARACALTWSHDNDNGDIIAYRVVESAPAASLAATPQGESLPIGAPKCTCTEIGSFDHEPGCPQLEWLASNHHTRLIPPPLTLADVDERIARALQRLRDNCIGNGWLAACEMVAAELRKETK